MFSLSHFLVCLSYHSFKVFLVLYACIAWILGLFLAIQDMGFSCFDMGVFVYWGSFCRFSVFGLVGSLLLAPNFVVSAKEYVDFAQK